jgi:predicted O-linked N-acetylglucosamine transferase (SPINDLY family)
VLLNRPYEDFMLAMEDGDFSLDSHPFGGYNMVIDSVFLGKPMVTFEGTRIYNRCSSALMRKIGMEELIAHNEEEYVAKALRLVEDDDYRQSLSQRLCETDLRKTVFDTDEPQYFRKAVDYLIANHAALQRDGSRTPIFIR